MTAITPIALELRGYKRITWNRTIPEYWKSLFDSGDFYTRLSVRFNEFIDQKRPIVYIEMQNAMYPIYHLETVEQVEQLYELIKYKPECKP